MRLRDYFGFVEGAVSANPARTVLAGLGIAIGVAAVVLLTSIGQGLHAYITEEFTQFGTNLIDISPGRTQTGGMSAALFGTVRPLSLEDARAVRRARYIVSADPIVAGNAQVGFGARRRRVTVYGVSADFPRTLRMKLAIGSFLAAGDLEAARPEIVLGSKVESELFGGVNPLGKKLTLAEYRYRVIGVMAPKGQLLGFDFDDTVYIPVASAMELFNRASIMGMHVAYDPAAPLPAVEQELRNLLIRRHGREDFTLTPQKQSMQILDSILNVLTLAIAGIGAISVVVGAIGILTIMFIAVGERTSEIGLLHALGAGRRQILWLFLGEAVIVALLGGAAGVALGTLLARALALGFGVQTRTSLAAIVIAEASLIVVGIVAGVAPARRAAALDPLASLRAE